MAESDPDYTLRLAAMAIERIKALNLVADPAGYELWYSYARGSNPELNRAINDKLDADGGMSMADVDKIYDEYLAPSRTPARLAQAASTGSAEIQNAIEMLDELILLVSQSRADCADASARLLDSADRSSVRAIADAIIGSLRNIEVRYTALEQRFARSRRELDSTQKTLAEISIEIGHDSVTRLANRRRFDLLLERALAMANAGRAPLSMLMIDIDDFKSFNDRFGHLTGDSVLRLVASTLIQSIKGQDLAARYGGDEFAVILPDTKLKDAIAVAENLRSKIARRELKRRSTGESLGAITVSIGAASYRHNELPRMFLERADASLYAAKHAGRNCSKSEDALNQAQENAA